MSDRLYLSLWTRHPSPLTMHERYATLLRTFPFSKLAPNLLLTIRGMSLTEAPALEQGFEGTGRMEEIREALEAWRNSDVSFEIEGAWDLLQPQEQDWKLAPAKVVLLAYGPEFERDGSEDLRVEFGRENLFVPEAESPHNFRMVEGNIRSLLKLVRDLENALPIERRLLWSESGENFAERLAQLSGG